MTQPTRRAGQHIDASYLADSHARASKGDFESRPMPIEYADGEPSSRGDLILFAACVASAALIVIGIACAARWLL